jgi:hypothetical protein
MTTKKDDNTSITAATESSSLAPSGTWRWRKPIQKQYTHVVHYKGVPPITYAVTCGAVAGIYQEHQRMQGLSLPAFAKLKDEFGNYLLRDTVDGIIILSVCNFSAVPHYDNWAAMVEFNCLIPMAHNPELFNFAVLAAKKETFKNATNALSSFLLASASSNKDVSLPFVVDLSFTEHKLRGDAAGIYHRPNFSNVRPLGESYEEVAVDEVFEICAERHTTGYAAFESTAWFEENLSILAPPKFAAPKTQEVDVASNVANTGSDGGTNPF